MDIRTHGRFIEIDLIEAEELAGLFFTSEEILVILTESPEDFQTAVLKGRLQADATIRRQVIEQAKGGSSEAQKIVEKWKLSITMTEAI